MKKITLILMLLLSLSILLTACGEREKKLTFTCAVDPGEYRPGDTVCITVGAENTGHKFNYIGAIQDHFSSPALSLKADGLDYTITNKWEVTTCDATKRQFQRGETASETFRISIPGDAVPGTYTFTCWVFGQKVELQDAVTILSAEDAPGPAEDTDPQLLTEDQALEIENAWYTTTGTVLGSWFDAEKDNLSDGVRYYGSYAGFQIIFRPTGDDAVTDLEVEGLTFSHNTGFELYAYQDGSFKPLQEVCALGALTPEDLRVIQLRHLMMEMQPSDGFYPLPTVTVDPDDTFELMKLAFLRQYAPDGDYTTKDLSVVYFGKYGEAHVAFINGIMVYTQALTSETVGGVTFHYNTGQKLLVYFDGELMGLGEAYDRGALTQEDLLAIRNAHNPQPEDTDIR